MEFIIGVIIVVSVLVYTLIEQIFTYWERRGIPTIKPKIPFGSIANVGSKIHWIECLNEIYNKYKGKSVLAGFYFLTSPRIIAIDLDFIKNILVKDFNNFRNRGFYYNEKIEPLSGHLFNLESEKWKDIRTKLSPTFTSGKMKMMYSMILNSTVDLINFFKKSTIIDVKDVCGRFSADVIGSCAFGLDYSCLKNDSSELVFHGRRILNFNTRRKQINFFIINTFKPIARFFNMKQFEKDDEEFFMKIIKETIEFRDKNNLNRNDFMNLLLQIHREGIVKGEKIEENVGKITYNEMIAQAFLFLVAGFETVTTLLTFAFYEIAKNQDIQNKIRKEIESVMEEHDNQLTYDAIMKLEYLGRVINETLRMYTPANTLFREAVTDYDIPGTNLRIDKGTAIIIPIYSIHNDPEIYPEPEKFDPDRFTSENIKSRHSFSFLPFGDGPRNCIGMRFALLESRLAIAMIIKSFNLTLNSKTPTKLEWDPSDFQMIIKGGIYLNAEEI